MAIIFLNSVNKLTILMVKCGVLFEVRTEFLNVIYKIFGFIGLKLFSPLQVETSRYEG
jgi:hypothetical protein